MRLQVFLSHAGVCSRRKALILIQSGHVCVNAAKVLEPSCAVDQTKDRVTLDGKDVVLPSKTYVLLHKPRGVTSTVKDRFAERTVLDLLPKNLRTLYPVGRLDKESSGLLLLTNDGALTHKMLHPSFGTEKTYRVVLNKSLSETDRARLEKGVFLEGQKTAPCKIRPVSSLEVEIVMHEGRKRQIRKMFALVRYHVVSLMRIRQGSLSLGQLKEGEWRLLTEEEITKLYREQKLEGR